MAIYRHDADFSLPYNRPSVVDPATGLVHRGACIRLAPDGCYIHSNEAHVNLGIRSVQVSTTTGNLMVYMDGEGPVTTAHADGDETITGRRGILVGVQRGTSTLALTFYDTRLGRYLDLSDRDDYLRAAGEFCNVWVHFLGVAA